MAAINKGSSKVELALQLLCCLWFFAAHFDISVTALHIAGVLNCTADHLSRNYMSQFFHSNPQASVQSIPFPEELLELVSSADLGLDIPSLRASVQEYYKQGLASSTMRSYTAGQRRFQEFCLGFNTCALPASEETLMLFLAYLAKDGLAY